MVMCKMTKFSIQTSVPGCSHEKGAKSGAIIIQLSGGGRPPQVYYAVRALRRRALACLDCQNNHDHNWEATACSLCQPPGRPNCRSALTATIDESRLGSGNKYCVPQVVASHLGGDLFDCPAPPEAVLWVGQMRAAGGERILIPPSSCRSFGIGTSIRGF